MEQALSSPGFAREASRSSSKAIEGAVVLLAVLGAPLVLYLAHLAPYARMLYPASNFLLAGYLFARRSPWYLGHCLLVFCFVSLVRRLVDEQAGWDASNPVLLTPYLCSLFAGIRFLEYWSRPEPRGLGPFLVITFGIAYGAMLATLHGRLLSSLVDTLKWSVGPLFAVYALAHRETLSEIRAVVESCLVWAGTAMAAYGIWQFIQPQTWDAFWMRSVVELGLDSIGQPQPFAVRVFSTMNSPGSFGAIMSAGIVVALQRRTSAMAPAMTLMLVGLALCQYRSIWFATAVALLMIVCSRRAALRPANVAALVAIGFVLCTTAVVPSIREAIVQRAASLATLKADRSLETRRQQYSSLAGADHLILGEGLAINGASRRLDKEPPVHMDGALIEIWRAMGVVIGTLFLLSVAVLVARLFWPSPPPGSPVFFDRAIVVATFILLPIGSVHIGELGLCAWMFLGFALAARCAKRS